MRIDELLEKKELSVETINVNENLLSAIKVIDRKSVV